MDRKYVIQTEASSRWNCISDVYQLCSNQFNLQLFMDVILQIMDLVTIIQIINCDGVLKEYTNVMTDDIFGLWLYNLIIASVWSHVEIVVELEWSCECVELWISQGRIKEKKKLKEQFKQLLYYFNDILNCFPVFSGVFCLNMKWNW